MLIFLFILYQKPQSIPTLRLLCGQNRNFGRSGKNRAPYNLGRIEINDSFLTAFLCFLLFFSPKTMLSSALVRVGCTHSKAVDGQKCCHWANCAKLKPQKLNYIYPMSSFSSAVSIPYVLILVNTIYSKLKKRYVLSTFLVIL